MKCKFIASRQDKKWPRRERERERGWQPHGAGKKRRGRGEEGRFRNAATDGGEGTNRPRKGEKERVNARILIMATRPGCGLAGVLFLATCFVRFREALRLRMGGTLQLPALFHPRTDEFHFTRRGRG